MSRAPRVKWTEPQDALLRSLWRAGVLGPDIAQQITDMSMGVRRAAHVFARAHRLGMPKRDRGGRQGSVSVAGATPNRARSAPHPGIHQVNNAVVPPDRLEDAQRRFAAPRSLTAVLMGDPAPGQSALDQRAGL